MIGATASLGPCPLCGRVMIERPSIDRHHWVPKRKSGGFSNGAGGPETTRAFTDDKF